MEGLVTGRIVHFVFSVEDAEKVARARDGAPGNLVEAGDRAPAVIVGIVDPAGSVNLKVLLDGPDTFWATSVGYSEDAQPRTWHWTKRE